MIISDCRIEKNADYATLLAEVCFENNDKPPLTLNISLPRSRENMLQCSFEPFLLGAFPAALLHSEHRIHIEGNLCPYLKSNLEAAMRLQKHWWFTKDHRLPTITAVSYFPTDLTHNDRAPACFFSGGIDSISALLTNAQTFSTDHPMRYKYALLAFGLDIGDPNREIPSGLFERALAEQDKLAQELDLTLIPIYTNIRDIEPDGKFYETMHFAALLSGLAHALGNRINSSAIASDLAAEYLTSWGGHPSLNCFYRSSYQDFLTECHHLDRTQKVGLVAQNETALASIRVCYNTDHIDNEHINCGYCEKCVRTKLALLAYGKLEHATCFPDSTIDIDKLRLVNMKDILSVEYYNERLADLLEQRGHHNYSDVVRTINGTPKLTYRIKRFIIAFKKAYWRIADRQPT
ncbi:hypothetical protein [Psychrobium sp. 1_MG-2023]|uniref:hypothetical protein n=1 Tax=Psychrobium sp. 1_MG-2023 TaxID=3062624 RepID=UPI000C342B15|nr:hypothetical protein [Psychrobium sp. 1_MG-2023]MDP2561431.1 hypothetical protein [Psychrobium sp. 1_MG-2023]PKF57698.1 hypothetical protein CW748_05760 [Alteromonadales bacterium alter-6D02]